MEIEESARKHGIADDDMLHAATHPLRLVRQDEHRVLHIGGDTTGRPLEVVVVDNERIIHAMELRESLYPYL
jgi:hypothetical protein